MDEFMEVFDKVKEEIVDVAGEVSKKAEETSKVVKLQREQRQKQKFVDNIYKELGKKYYDEHKEDSDEDFTELEAALDRIDEIKSEIADAKGTVRTCSNCGQSVSEDASYCPNCGEKLEEDVEVFDEDDITVED